MNCSDSIASSLPIVYLSELVAGVPRGAQNFGYVRTGLTFYPLNSKNDIYSENDIRPFGRLKAILYFQSL